METFIIVTILITCVWILFGLFVVLDYWITFDDIERLPLHKQYIICALLFSPQVSHAVAMISLVLHIIERCYRYTGLSKPVSNFIKWLWEK